MLSSVLHLFFFFLAILLCMKSVFNFAVVHFGNNTHTQGTITSRNSWSNCHLNCTCISFNQQEWISQAKRKHSVHCCVSSGMQSMFGQHVLIEKRTLNSARFFTGSCSIYADLQFATNNTDRLQTKYMISSNYSNWHYRHNSNLSYLHNTNLSSSQDSTIHHPEFLPKNLALHKHLNLHAHMANFYQKMDFFSELYSAEALLTRTPEVNASNHCICMLDVRSSGSDSEVQFHCSFAGTSEESTYSGKRKFITPRWIKIQYLSNSIE